MVDASREELADAYRVAIEKAQKAPLGIYHLDHDGHRWVQPNDSCFRFANEAFRLRDQLKALDAQTPECGEER